MAFRFHPKLALHFDGIKLNPGPLVRSQELCEKVYGILLGPNYSQAPSDERISHLRTRAARILCELFALCLARVDTFVALGNCDLGWQVVAGDIAEQYHCTMTAAEVEELVSFFTDARRRYLVHHQAGTVHAIQPSELTVLIDRWMDATRQQDRVPSGTQIPSQLSLAARPAPLENLLAGFSLQSPGTHATTAPTAMHAWPPSHLLRADIELLNHGKIREHRWGVCWSAKGPMPAFPGDKSDPLALRLFLGWLAAAHTPPSPPSTPLRFLPPPSPS